MSGNKTEKKTFTSTICETKYKNYSEISAVMTECCTPLNVFFAANDFLVTKFETIDINAMPNDLIDSSFADSKNEESGFLYYPGPPVHKYKENESKISSLTLN